MQPGYPPQGAGYGYPPQGYPPQAPAPQQGPPPPHGYPQQGYPPQGGFAPYPPQQYAPQQGPPPQGYQYPPQGYPQGYPPHQQFPPQQFPPQQPPPQHGFPQGPPASGGGGAWHENLTFDEFNALFQQEARTLEGCVKCFCVAAYEYFGNQNKDGLRMIALCLPNDQVNADGTAKRGYWHEQFGKKAGSSVSKGQTKAPIPASYIGGTPANHYRPDYNYRVVEDHQYKHTHENTATEKKIFVRSGGKDMPSPVFGKCNKHGIWKLFEFSSLYTGIKTDEDLTDF